MSNLYASARPFGTYKISFRPEISTPVTLLLTSAAASESTEKPRNDRSGAFFIECLDENDEGWQQFDNGPHDFAVPESGRACRKSGPRHSPRKARLWPRH